MRIGIVTALVLLSSVEAAIAQGVQDDPRRRRFVLPSVREATDCIAREILNEPGIEGATRIGRRTAAEAELAALATVLDASATNEPEPRTRICLDGRIILYVGGRPRQVASLRRFVEGCGGRLLSHDAGVEDNMSLLAGLIAQADLVVFPTSCVSHEATWQLKRSCETAAKPFYPVRSASLASFVRAVMPPAV